MVGIGETYFPAFVLAVTASQLACGLAASVPVVLGALVQMVTPRLLARMGSYRRWVVICALLQVLAFALLLAAIVRGGLSTTGAFAIIALYWGAGMAGGSAWSDWVVTLVPPRMRARYFALRSRLAQTGVLLGFVAGGVLLQVGSRGPRSLSMFALLFAAAGACRLLSARFLNTQSEPAAPLLPPAPPRSAAGWRPWWPHEAGGGLGRAFLYLLALQLGLQIAAPYFTPYMLGQLNFSYGQYVALMCTALMAKIACLPALGRLAERFGVRGLLWVAGLALMVSPAMWLVSDSFGYLLLAQIVGGIAVGGYELGLLLLAFESIPPGRRLGLLTVFNLANSAALLLGSLLGSGILLWLGQNAGAYHAVFIISTLARGAALLVLADPSHWLHTARLTLARLTARPKTVVLHRITAEYATATPPPAKPQGERPRAVAGAR